ncbi:MAG: amidohydrolase [Peptococcaceae bacterium]|nr:amidohydrolase [Peptococcaceae bacterium]
MSILIRNVILVTMTDDGIISPGSIAVEGQNIVFAGPSEDLPADFQAQEIIDGEGMVATPGLVNCHTHAAMTLFRGYADDLPLMEWLSNKIWPIEARLTGQDVYWGTKLACLEMIKSGTTTFADMYFFMDDVARAVEECGLRACLARGLIGLTDANEQALNESRDFIGKWDGQGDGRITCMLGPHAPYTCPPDYLKKVIQAAERLGVRVHIHLAETLSEVEQIKNQYGCSPIELVDRAGLFSVGVLAAHCVHLSEQDIDILINKGAGIAHNPQSNMKLGSGVAPLARLLKNGAKVGIGTDGAASNNDLDMVDETRTAALLQKAVNHDPTVVPADQAWAMATTMGAAALGMDDLIGTLEAGKKADIVLWNWKGPHLSPSHNVMAHLVYSVHGYDADTVIINGRIVMRHRQVLTMDEEAVLAEATKCAQRLVEG